MPFAWPAYWSFALDALARLADSVTVESIMTPRLEFVSVSKEATVETAIQRAGKNPIDQLPIHDQLPVEDLNGGIIGLAFVDELAKYPPQTLVGSAFSDLQFCTPIPSTACLRDALAALTHFRARLVSLDDQVVGLVHVSDVNKHAAKSYFYLWLSALEAGLAKTVRWYEAYLGRALIGTRFDGETA